VCYGYLWYACSGKLSLLAIDPATVEETMNAPRVWIAAARKIATPTFA